MGLGRLNPGCNCICNGDDCTDEQLPVFSGWTAISTIGSPGSDNNGIIGTVTWPGISTGRVDTYRDGVLIGSSTSTSPIILSLQSANNASLDGSYRFVIDNGCSQTTEVTCNICSFFGRQLLYPAPSPSHVIAYPGSCVDLCAYIPNWIIPSGYAAVGTCTLNPYSCVECGTLPEITYTAIYPWPYP